MNEWHIVIRLKNGAILQWSSRFRMWTALPFRAAYYSSKGQAEKVARRLREKNPGELIEVRRIGDED